MGLKTIALSRVTIGLLYLWRLGASARVVTVTLRATRRGAVLSYRLRFFFFLGARGAALPLVGTPPLKALRALRPRRAGRRPSYSRQSHSGGGDLVTEEG